MDPSSSEAAGTQQYRADFDGFRDYLESIKGSEPQLYGSLDPDLSELE
jgi:hypothetical protein